MPTKSVVVGSAVGLHARPAAIIAEKAAELGSEVTINGVDASSSLSLVRRRAPAISSVTFLATCTTDGPFEAGPIGNVVTLKMRPSRRLTSLRRGAVRSASTVPQFGFAPYCVASRSLGVEGLPCRPCTHVGRTACPLGHFKCMREIPAAAAVHAAREIANPPARA